MAIFATSSKAAASPTPVSVTTSCTVTFSTAGLGLNWVVPTEVASESFTLYGAVDGLALGVAVMSSAADRVAKLVSIVQGMMEDGAAAPPHHLFVGL